MDSNSQGCDHGKKKQRSFAREVFHVSSLQSLCYQKLSREEKFQLPYVTRVYAGQKCVIDADIERYLSIQDRDNALIYASRDGKPEVVKILLSRGIDVHVDNDKPICLAADYGHAEVVEVLLAAKANARARCNLPLLWAARRGALDVVKILLAAGAELWVFNKNELYWDTKTSTVGAIIKVLLDAGVEVSDLPEFLREKIRELDFQHPTLDTD